MSMEIGQKNYHFAVLRYVPNVLAGEFVNIGVAMWVPETRELVYKLNLLHGRVSEFFRAFSPDDYRPLLRHLAATFAGLAQELRQGTQGPLFSSYPSRPVSLEDILSRLTGDNDAVFQWSNPMGGRADNPKARLEDLFLELVSRHDREREVGVSEETLWRNVAARLNSAGLLEKLDHGVMLTSNHYEYSFHAGWMNGQQQVLEPISFDLKHGTKVLDKANRWSGRLSSLSKGGPPFQFTAVVVPPSEKEPLRRFGDALAILRDAPHVRNVILEPSFDGFLPEIEKDLFRHRP